MEWISISKPFLSVYLPLWSKITKLCRLFVWSICWFGWPSPILFLYTTVEWVGTALISLCESSISSPVSVLFPLNSLQSNCLPVLKKQNKTTPGPENLNVIEQMLRGQRRFPRGRYLAKPPSGSPTLASVEDYLLTVFHSFHGQERFSQDNIPLLLREWIAKGK